MPGSYLGDNVTLARTSHFAYLLTLGNSAGGAENEKSTLFTSDNDGATWVNRGEVCGQNPGPEGEVDSIGMTGGSDDSIIVTCQPRLASSTARSWVTVSTDSGGSFQASAATLPGSPGVVGAGTAQDLCVQVSVLYCTRDGGGSFAKAHTVNGDTVSSRGAGKAHGSNGKENESRFQDEFEQVDTHSHLGPEGEGEGDEETLPKAKRLMIDSRSIADSVSVIVPPGARSLLSAPGARAIYLSPMRPLVLIEAMVSEGT